MKGPRCARRIAGALIVLCALGGARAHAEEAPDEAARAFALGTWLAKEGEPYRAAGELLRAIYLAGPRPLALEAQLALARTLEGAGLLDRSADAYRRFLARGEGHAARAGALLDLGWLDLVAGDLPGARDGVTGALALAAPDEAARVARQRRGRLILGLAEALEGRYQAALPLLDQAAAGCPPAGPGDCGSALRARALAAAGPPKGPSPLLAAALGAVLPGAGHLTVGQPRDGITYFVLTGLLGFLAVDGYQSGRGAGGQRPGFYFLAGAGTLVYVANIVSAWNAAVRKTAIDLTAYRRGFTDRPWPEPGAVP